MKFLITACCVLLLTTFSAQIVNAEAKVVLRTSLEIVPDGKAYDAKLQISQSDFASLRAGVAGDSGSAPIVGGISLSSTRTIVAGLLMFLALSVGGVLLARSSSVGRFQKVFGAALIAAVVLGAAAIITRGNAGPPPSFRWRNLPQALAEGKPTLGTM
ncbi:MAG TPA: hypothetical protein VJ875_12455, partial [Pyrinomonadaceae bacterium]|nr:hypothetical protein [Pyrinomonadaceae bacterium]